MGVGFGGLRKPVIKPCFGEEQGRKEMDGWKRVYGGRVPVLLFHHSEHVCSRGYIRPSTSTGRNLVHTSAQMLHTMFFFRSSRALQRWSESLIFFKITVIFKNFCKNLARSDISIYRRPIELSYFKNPWKIIFKKMSISDSLRRTYLGWVSQKKLMCKLWVHQLCEQQNCSKNYGYIVWSTSNFAGLILRSHTND